MTFKLGELIAYAETALAFCRAAAKDKVSEASAFDREGWQALARIHARYAASWIASEGMRLVAGNSDEGGAGLVDSLDLKTIASVQKGAAADMDLAVTKLIAVYKVEG